MSSKKNKKQKWISIETDVISIASGTCWADEAEKEHNGKHGFAGFGFEPKPLNLPKAPRAACESIIDESTVPQEGPFLVHMSNLQFEIDEDDITNYFKGLKINNIKLPRNDNGRNKGFGYVEFEERKELITALGMENLIRGRRVRVELASGMQDSRNAFQRGSRMGMDFPGGDEPGDWRSTNRTSTTTDDRGGFTRRRDGGAFDKDHDSERDNGPWRGARCNVDDDVARKPFSDRRFDDSESGRRPFSDRRGDDSEGGRRPFGDRRGDDSEGGRRPFGDRRGDDSDSGRRPFGDRRYDDSDSGRRPFGERRDDVEGGRKPFGESRRGFGFNKRDDDLPEIAGDNTSLPQERPKLILKPKTVDPDAPTTEAPSYVAAPSIFGGAKPVDTAAKEREIEEKLLAKNEPKPQSELSRASSETSLNETSDNKCQEETEVKPPPQPKSVETWRRRSPRRQSDDDRVPRRRVSPERNPRYEEAPPPRENAWEKHTLIKESLSSEENMCNGTPPIVEDEKPRPNVYIPPNLRKKNPSDEETVVIGTEESEPIREATVPDVDKNIPDRAADGSEIIEPIVVEAPTDVRTDPDGQSSEPDVVKDQPVTEEDTNDSGFIECGKNSSDKYKSKKKPKVIKKLPEIEVKKKDPVITKELKKSTSNKFAALLDDGSNE
ncbi:eukaryotic translation initiation factor 4B [Myzus persicae]|uniref:eukaryotic translation initiation factor 4B n=1 Tax=Myzus persicae TaxID=13164 RepID=UPI000B9359BA|nr:eukaryotic translation initiation factor 4B [Myzus persicae]